MGKKNVETYGRRNSGEGEVLVRIKPTRVIAEKNIAGWEWCFLSYFDFIVAQNLIEYESKSINHYKHTYIKCINIKNLLIPSIPLLLLPEIIPSSLIGIDDYVPMLHKEYNINTKNYLLC